MKIGELIRSAKILRAWAVLVFAVVALHSFQNANPPAVMVQTMPPITGARLVASR
jgi:hypothetical protein